MTTLLANPKPATTQNSRAESHPAPVLTPMKPGVHGIANAAHDMRHVFVRDMIVTCLVGVYKHEHTEPQRVRINVDLGVLEKSGTNRDDLSEVVCYEQICHRVRSIAGDGHVNLVETMATRIADICLQDRRIRSARVRVEKLDVIPDAVVGVEIERLSHLPPL